MQSTALGGSAARDPGILAAPGVRLWAVSIDGLIATIAWLPCLASVVQLAWRVALAGEAPPTVDELLFEFMSGPGLLISIAANVVFLLVTAVFVWRYSQTIGKRIMRIKVVRADGSPASFARILWLRNVVNTLPNLIPVVGGLYIIADSLLIFSERHQCLHDRIADTIVVECAAVARAGQQDVQ
jgi:uncharacterized RDD family membrane protein YckC